MKPLRIFWAAFSLALFSCASIPRPDANLCVVNAPGKKLTCYHLQRDFQEDGNIRPGAQPHFKSAPDIASVNKHVIMSSDDFVKLKAYIKKLREEYENGCKLPQGASE